MCFDDEVIWSDYPVKDEGYYEDLEERYESKMLLEEAMYEKWERERDGRK